MHKHAEYWYSVHMQLRNTYYEMCYVTYWYSIPGAVDEQKSPWCLVV